MTKTPFSTCKKCLLSLLALLIIVATYFGEIVYQEFAHQTYQSKSKIYPFLRKIYLTGIIAPGDASQLQEILDSAFITPDEISIDSGGGDIYEAMKIGAIIKNNNLNITVRYHCLSACANYIFPAAQKKIIFEDSILGWHGSLGSSDDWFMQPTLDISFVNGQFREQSTTYSISGLPEKWRARVDLIGHQKFQELEKEYFSYISTSELLPICGQKQNVQNIDIGTMTSKNGLPADFFQSMKWHYFYYSVSDLRKFGVQNIELRGEETEWTKTQEHFNSTFAKFCQKQPQ